MNANQDLYTFCQGKTMGVVKNNYVKFFQSFELWKSMAVGTYGKKYQPLVECKLNIIMLDKIKLYDMI